MNKSISMSIRVNEEEFDNSNEIFCGLMLYQEDGKISLNEKIIEEYVLQWRKI